MDSQGPPGFREARLLELLKIRMVGLSEASRYWYGWSLRGPPVFVWLDSKTPPVFRIVGLSEARRLSYGFIFKGHHVFVWLDSQRLPGIRIVGLLEAPGNRMDELLEAPRCSYDWTFRGLLVLGQDL